MWAVDDAMDGYIAAQTAGVTDRRAGRPDRQTDRQADRQRHNEPDLWHVITSKATASEALAGQESGPDELEARS